MLQTVLSDRLQHRSGDRSECNLKQITLFLLILCSSPSAAAVSRSKAGKLTLHAAGFFPVSTKIPQGSIGRGVIPAVELALQHINDSPKILRGIHLDLVWNDTECDAALGMKTLFDMLDAPPAKVMLFGDACNSVTDPIAKASKFFHLIQLSYADTHPMYTSESYPNFFRVVPSESAFNAARLAFVRKFNWTRVGTIYQNSRRYSLPHTRLQTDLDLAKVEITITQSISDETGVDLQKLKEKDVRIIIGFFDEVWAQRIFCQAYQMGLYGRKYQWILGSFDKTWWLVPDDSLLPGNCTGYHVKDAADGLFSIDVLPLSSSNEITVSGMTAAEYESMYNKAKRNEYSKYHGYAYDGVWTIAHVIHSVTSKLRAQNSDLTFRNFKYKDPFWAQFMRQALNETFFVGVTGNVSFDGNERRGSILLKQLQSGREVQIAEYHSTRDILMLRPGEQIYWRGGNAPPVDRTFREIHPSRVSLTLFVVISIFAMCGIVLACVFLAMNIKYRNQKNIKMSSPYLNNMIIIGCILTYTSVILLGLDSSLTSEANFPYICAARAWVLMSGFTLAFGSMFSKTYRVHAIFTNIKLNKKIIKDYKLFMVVGVLVAIDIVTLTAWQILDPFYRKTRLGVPVPSPQNEDIVIVPEMEFCQSKRMTIFLGAIYVYKGLLMAFGIFLAWETRHVSIPALNDSKYIGMSVYNVVIMCVIGAGVSFVLRDQQDAAFVIISIFIIFCSTATLCLVFVPKRTYELEALMFRLRGLTATTNGTSPESISVIGLALPQTSAADAGRDAAETTAEVAPAVPLKQVYVIVSDKETISGLNTGTSLVSMSPSPITCSAGSGASGEEGSLLKRRRSSEVSSKSGSEMERGSISVAASSINRPAAGGTTTTRAMHPSASCFTVKMSECQVVRDVRNNNFNKNGIAAPASRPKDEDSSYALAIRNSSPHVPDPSSAVPSDSGDDDADGDEDDEVIDRDPFGATSAEGNGSDRFATVRRRTRSEGTIAATPTTTTTAPAAFSCMSASEESPEQRSNVLSLLNQLPGMNQRDSPALSAHLSSFSSYPSIKCDIIEYL